MYGWVWHHLPGGLAGRLATSTVLVLGVVALLFYVVFPAVDPHLPFNQVDVTHDGGTNVPSVHTSVVPGTASPAAPVASPTATTTLPGG